MECDHNHCGACCGRRCSDAFALSGPEICLLQILAQTPFLPVTRQKDTGMPVLLDEKAQKHDAFSAAITGLCQKRLIRLDYDIPLKNFNYEKYRFSTCHGSIALTATGQAVIDQLEIQGIER